jgi:hypothetical protein
MDDDKNSQNFLSPKPPPPTSRYRQSCPHTVLPRHKDCSDKFSLPVISLHNNAVNDTAKYSGGHKGKDEFKLDVDKSKQGNGRRCCQGMEEILAKRYGDQGKTRWSEPTSTQSRKV